MNQTKTMSLTNIIGNKLGEVFKVIFKNDLVEDAESTEKILANAKKSRGPEHVTEEDANLLSETEKLVSAQARALTQSQENTIPLYVTDKIILAKNEREMKKKAKKENKVIMRNIDKNFAKNGDLPKDYTITKAEETNGIIQTIPAGELENQPREKGGRERDSRTRK